jgi:hypothetical protein
MLMTKSTFSQFIPSNFDAYTFFELNYLAATDSVFDACVLSDWIETGLLMLKKNDKRIFIMDMKEGQRALDNLNEVLGMARYTMKTLAILKTLN